MTMPPLAPPVPRALGRWLAGGALVAGTAALAYLLAAARGSLLHLLPGYDEWQQQAYARLPQFLRWCLGDTTEAQSFKADLGGLGLLAGGWVAHVAAARRRRSGFPIAAGTGLWPWLTGAALLGLLLSNLAWGWTIPATGAWQPTFVAFVSIPPAVVLTYGPGWRVALTGAVLGAVLTTPIAIALVQFACYPLGLPTSIATAGSMWLSALLVFPLCRVLPWFPRRPAPPPSPVEPPRQGPAWVLRRVLADFTEAPFHGNELSSAGLLAGTLLTYLLNPLTPVHGSGLLPALLTTQVLTATLGVLLYRRQWARHGWYPTFVPLVSVAPAAVVTYGPTIPAIVSGAVLGAVFGPPLAAYISRRLPDFFHPFVGNVVSMTVCTALVVPVLGLFPGFGR
ncbi:hypothetical protein VSH64_16185 [Amycolatopsis rhabdoformis]|uniref:Integral membrane protein n=1 Tax=Amycolatopsis rhabdoformis TaxID=1448059 RepID=A0ABZ1IGW4_9PSEU|nr:hypothetical protein [Amycolatopsis rhabdoformis]WSE33627.1 hypothetical protein VSH64_16185 [Amycolatopsis rhabdoformis]